MEEFSRDRSPPLCPVRLDPLSPARLDSLEGLEEPSPREPWGLVDWEKLGVGLFTEFQLPLSYFSQPSPVFL